MTTQPHRAQPDSAQSHGAQPHSAHRDRGRAVGSRRRPGRTAAVVALAVTAGSLGVTAPALATGTPAAGQGTSWAHGMAVRAVGGHTTAQEKATTGSTKRTALPTSGTTILVNTATGAAGARLARTALAAQGAAVTAQWPEIGVTVGLAPTARAEKVATVLRHTRGVSSAGTSGLVGKELPRARRVHAAAPTGKEVPGAIATASRGPQANRLATGRGVEMAVADTGVLDEHSDLAGRLDLAHSGSCTRGGAFTNAKDSWRPAKTTDWYTHGTEVASVAVANRDGHGIVGIAPQARVVSLRVVADDGDIYPESSICAAMQAARLHLPVANHSYGLDTVTPLRHGFYDPAQADQAAVIQAVTRAFAWSRAHGVLNVVATGNEGEDQSSKPTLELPAYEQHQGPVPARTKALLGEVPSVLGVGESLANGQVASASAVGFGIVDLSAVGAGRMATTPNTWDQDAGTSFASPAVAATAVLVRQLQPHATPAQLEQVLERSAIRTTCSNAGELYSDQPCRSRGAVTNFFGHGRLDALHAVQLARQGTAH